ncbi:MAG: PTS mannose/fructose/sorbose transporter subunit IIC [Streptococcaceae bacterium]|jgi:PTS system mannose-specific IIC component|nr:PTS mannose/fructose/sorbose transporter subunit IIC [Streptococcaceae bacterium]
MHFSAIEVILVLIVAFLAGMEGILDEFQFHQPLVACTLIGLVTGNLTAGIILGGSIQMIALGWANIGAAVAPDAALASVAATLILIMNGGDLTDKTQIAKAVGSAIILAVAGLFLTMIVRTVSTLFVHRMDAAAKKANFTGVEFWHLAAVCLQGIRIAIPAGLIIAIGPTHVQALLGSMPDKVADGMAVGGGMVVAVGYAMVINMIASREVWPFFAIGFVVAAISQITLIGLGVLGVALALIYISLSKMGSSGSGGNSSGDPVGDIIDSY